MIGKVFFRERKVKVNPLRMNMLGCACVQVYWYSPLKWTKFCQACGLRTTFCSKTNGSHFILENRFTSLNSHSTSVRVFHCQRKRECVCAFGHWVCMCVCMRVRTFCCFFFFFFLHSISSQAESITHTASSRANPTKIDKRTSRIALNGYNSNTNWTKIKKKKQAST